MKPHLLAQDHKNTIYDITKIGAGKQIYQKRQKNQSLAALLRLAPHRAGAFFAKGRKPTIKIVHDEEKTEKKEKRAK